MKFKGNVAAPTISLVIDVNCFAIVFLLLRKALLLFFIWATCGSSFTYNTPAYSWYTYVVEIPRCAGRPPDFFQQVLLVRR